MGKGKTRTEILEAEGWTRQFLAGEPRLSEAVEMYRELGFEVYLEPIPKNSECESCAGTEDKRACRVCFEGFEDLYKIIFTRPMKGQRASDDDLYA
jgi:hypothetical protein